MPPQDHWCHIDWKRNDERRFRLALGVSVLIHALLLLAWKLPPQAWRATDNAILTVVLRGVAPLAQSGQPDSERKHHRAALVQNDPTMGALSLTPKATMPMAVATTAPATRPVAAAMLARAPFQTTSGLGSNAPAARVGVLVRLLIGTDGRVDQIFWDKLPALTDDQFRRLEAVIREKNYQPGQTLNEIVDVRAILKLPPARTDESPMPPQPAAE